MPMQSIKVGLVPATTRSANSWRSNFRLIKVPVLWRFASQIDHSSKELCIRDLTFFIFFSAPLDGFWIALKDYGIVGDKRLVKSEVRRTNLLGIDLSLLLCTFGHVSLPATQINVMIRPERLLDLRVSSYQNPKTTLIPKPRANH